jgi:hypothetical protein
MLGVIATYKLIGNDHMKATIINTFLDIKEGMMAKQAGRQSIINVFNMDSILVAFE